MNDISQLQAIQSLTICNLSLSENPISETDGYREKMFELFADLQILDGKDKEGVEQESLDGSIEDDDEEGEGELEELDEETIKKLRE